ncbi:putative polymerase with PALM domain, HD hydrolase domain and Zn ribbon [Desulfosporosinus acidiphilus SJ4]|uniref:Putative polymerase with PALM domain, HD hydrolase domain and Zn ribbon n=1 Tax=Desulfosporosinus acidiphilus (strain DSM 22704 / JCM 16185 / SJ4) TaxID=646529 RepID=I4DA45_DESAJ|nr:FapA family protein [Desulfosporosinus acidiphilus]AFM42669.1 putative polymerase with PALM domain, HD hydrolase domain and Zn ribbon [Desulfosporosinus acidiphilus SJ4]
MPEEVVQGSSLEEIKQEWVSKLKLSEEEITVEVLEKPRFLSRKWKVRLTWNEKIDQAPEDSHLISTQVTRVEDKYKFIFGEGVKRFAPFTRAGEVNLNGKLQDKPFYVNQGDEVEFYPYEQSGQLTWELEVRKQGLVVAAKVKHELPGRYLLPDELLTQEIFDLAQFARWETLSNGNNEWDEAKLNSDLDQLKVVYGRRPQCWTEIMSVEGTGEVIVAEATLPVPPQHAKLEDFVGDPQKNVVSEDDDKIDFFASKVKLVEEGTVLARKIPGEPGIPGKDVFGKELGAAAVKDFQFRVKKNAHLTEDGLEVIASCSGQPVRVDEKTYMVENVFVQNQDVDLATGSIDFPGDVYVNGNVQDGLHIFAGGKIEIKGSVSRAEIRAEKGAQIYGNIMGGKTFIGEKFVARSELLRTLTDMKEQLSSCLANTAALIKASGASNLKPGQCLKLILEKQYTNLPKLCTRIEKFIIDHKDDDMVSEGLIVTIQTAKRFLVGLGPLELQSVPALQRVDQALGQYVENMSVEIPEKITLEVAYLQGANVECGGSFKCSKGIYNSEIHIVEDVIIEGVCRGGKIFAGGNAKINELGGSGVSATYVQIGSDSRLSVSYCHQNVVVTVGKEIIQIEEDCKQLEIYRENGRVQVEKLKANPM